VAGRVLRIDALELRVHAGQAGCRRHLDLELPGPAEQRGLQPVHVDALLVPEDVARVARHGDAVERALRAVQAPGHAHPALVEADRAPELAVALEAEVAAQHVTVQDREVHLARDPELRTQRGERDAPAIGEIGAVAGEAAGFDGDVGAFEGDLDLRAEGQGRGGAEARGPGPEGESPRQDARTPLVEPAADVRKLQVEGHALMVELELATRHDQAADLHLAPRRAQGDAREVVPTLLERVDPDARTLDHHARQHHAAVEQGGERGRDGQARHFQEGLRGRGGAVDAQVRDLQLQRHQVVAHAPHGDGPVEDAGEPVGEGAGRPGRHAEGGGGKGQDDHDEDEGAALHGGPGGNRRVTPGGRGGRPSPRPGPHAPALP
jgi:hypothetical protein